MRISDWSSDVCSSDLSEMSPPSPSSALDVEHADQREQAPRGVEIDLDLAVETFDQHLRRLVVQRAARHVDGLDLLRGRRADRLIIAVADREIVADRPAKAPEAEDDRFERRSEEHTSELQSLMRNSYAVFCLKKKKNTHIEKTD